MSEQERGQDIPQLHGMLEPHSLGLAVTLNTNGLSNECKRRKLKCSGGETCTRCDRDNVTCIYDANRSSTHPSEFKDSRYDLSRLTDQWV